MSKLVLVAVSALIAWLVVEYNRSQRGEWIVRLGATILGALAIAFLWGVR